MLRLIKSILTALSYVSEDVTRKRELFLAEVKEYALQTYLHYND